MPILNKQEHEQAQPCPSASRPRFRCGMLCVLWCLVGAAAFHASYAWGHVGWMVGLYLFALAQLTRAETGRLAFYSGLALGLLIAAGRLEFFWTIFSAGALALWLVFAFWIALFVVLARLWLRRFTGAFGWLVLPFLWCGLEYFRSELYFLRFAWLTPGFAFGLRPPQFLLSHLGAYGLSFLLMVVACLASWQWPGAKSLAALILLLGSGGIGLASYFSDGVDQRSPVQRVLAQNYNREEKRSAPI